MSKTTMFERQQLAAAVAALEVYGLVMVPAMMAGTVATIFEGDHPSFRADYGVWGDDRHNPSAVYSFLQSGAVLGLCWVRCVKVIEQDMVEREGVEVESDQHFRELLAKYRREGLGWADELALYAYVYYASNHDLFFELTQNERNRYDELYNLVEKRTERAEQQRRERNKRGR